MNLTDWKASVAARYPAATITAEDGTGNTYGPEGSYTAHVGPDMQADVVGVWMEDYAWVSDHHEAR